MLSFFNPRFLTLANQSKSYLFLILLSLLITLSSSDNSYCTEQWTEINLDRDHWTRVGDVNEDTDKSSPLVFEFDQKDTSDTDIGGAVWHSYDFSKKRGLLISFKPTIKYDESYFGNVKYPQGFAIVFTSSSTENLMGEKGAGLGYEGIMNAIAFEFDFVKQSTYGDAKKPHFSVNYNIKGAISASTKDRTDNAINKILPNFYDNSLDGYVKNIIFEIEIIGNKLTVRSNRKDYEEILSTNLPEFQKLLEQEDVHIGITASMNQNKKIRIEDFKVSEVSMNEKGNLEIEGSETIPKVKAGEEVALLYSIKSTCGEKLKIYPDEYSGDDLKLIINNEEVKPEAFSFNEETVQLKMVVTETKENIYTALVYFKGQSSAPAKFIVTSSDINRMELCDPDPEKKYYLAPGFEQTKDDFNVPLCFYDQYGNRKQPKDIEMEKKIGFPDNLKPATFVAPTTNFSEKKFIVTIPFYTFGEYKIFSEDFIESKVRYINIMPESISPEKSEMSILYDQNIIDSENSVVSLKIKPRDNYGRDIPSVILKKMGCSFGSSIASTEDNSDVIEVTEDFKDDYVLLNVTNIQQSGRYKFTPRVKCDGMEPIVLDCGINSETKLNNCEFYKLMTQISTSHISVFDEYLGEYTIYESSNENYLYISLDEKESTKLTEVILLDSSGSPYLNIPSKQVTAEFGKDNLKVGLTVSQLANKYVLILPDGKTRENYTPTNTYDLIIKFDSSTFNIKIKFYFLDPYMTNTDTSIASDATIKSYKAFYKQNSFKLEASDTLLLFDVYELIDNTFLGTGSTLDISKIELYINGETTQSKKIEKHNSFLSVTCYQFSRVGKYQIKLDYDANNLADINIEIIPKKEANYLYYENNEIVDNLKSIEIGKNEHLKLIMADKYRNLIQNNEIYNAFSKIKISQHDIFDISLDYSGKIHVINSGKTGKTVTLTLPNNKTYTIESTYSPKFVDTDPLNSYGLINNNPIITKDEEIEMSLYLRDQFGNIISSSDIDDSVINIYIEGMNTKKIIPMSLVDKSSSDNRYKYKASVKKNGDYEIKIFIYNIPVECKTCHFRKNYEASAEITKATIYILGNKQKIPVINNHDVGLVDKTTGHFSFYLEERDEYNNEYKENKTLTFTFEAEDKNTDVTSVSICPSGSNEDERNFFKLCSGASDSWKKLPNGIYRLMALSDTLNFTIYLTDSPIDSSDSTPVIKYSSILLNNNEIYGKTDMPGNFIIDLRNKNFKRIQSIDTSKISINEASNTLKYEIAKGPEKGLLTIFLLAPMPGKYEFSVNYDNNKIIDNTYTYYCACGFDKKLKYISTEKHSNGNYAFFQILDSNNNNCILQYNWNDLSLKEYANNVFSATDSEDKNKYKLETYYNIMSNTFIFYFDDHVPNKISLSSNLFKLESATETGSISLNLISNILDENHFIVKHNNEELKIIPLNANYESEEIQFNLHTSDFDVSLIRIINDDFEIIKNDFAVSDNLVVPIDDSLLDAKGKYIYVVYYKGKELFCQNCIIDKTDNKIDMSKTKVYQKEGDNNYIPNDQSLTMPMMKSNYPFFKINLFSQNDNLVILDSINNLDIFLETKSGTKIDFRTKLNKNGNIYVYLSAEGRNTYINLDPMTIIKLKLTYSAVNYEASYYVFDYHKKKKNSIEYCSIGAIPEIINKQDTYIKRHDEELELEIYLSGCDEEHNEIKDTLKIKNKETGNDYTANLIPTDIIGGYILYLPTTIGVSDENYYYIMNNKAKSELFKLSVIPDYEVKEVSFIDDENMDETETDKLYTYFLVELKDEHKNAITNEGRNLFINDLNILHLDNDLPYRLTYDQNKKAFRCQVPINGFGGYNAETDESIEQPKSFEVKIGPPKLILNSLFKLEPEDDPNTFSFFMELVDEFYKDINKDSIQFEYQISFKYFTINPLTEEVFITDIEHKVENERYIINLKDSYPKYSIFGFIPYIGFLPQICPDCVILNENPDYIYSIEKERYIPHNLEKNLFLIKDEDYPIYLYLAHKSTTIEPTNANNKEIISTDKSKLYLITYNDGGDQIQVKFNSKIFSARFIDYSPQVEIENRAIPPYIENYGYKVNIKNNLDNIHIGFFMENRDSNGKLIITQPNLVIDDKFNGIIKRINVINTCYAGIYYIKITFSKSANIEFYPKFNTNHKNDVKYITMHLKAIAAFPTDIVLNNKEIINKNVVKFNLVASNSNSEQICDERLNIYIDDLNLKNFKKLLAQEGEDCSLYIKFTGETIIKSNINNFISDINNNDRTLYNINPLFSKLAISPNVFESTAESLSINFKEKTPAGVSYAEDEVNDNKNLYIYKYISPNKIKLIKTYSGLFSSDYLISPDQLNLERGFTYVLIGDIVDNNMPPSFVHYKKKISNNTEEVKSIEAYYFNEDKKANALSNFSGNKVTSGESLELNMPMLLKIKLLDSAGNPIDVVYNKPLTTKLILADGDDVIISYDLISLHYNDDTFLIKPKTDSISDLLHLPLYVEAGQYYLNISYKTNNFYSLISLKKTDLQYSAFQGKYEYPNVESTFNSFKVQIYNEDQEKIYISSDIPLIQQICFTKDSKIVNKHLDYYKLSLTGCNDINYAVSYMGCFAFTTKSCSSETLTVTYDGNPSSNNLNIVSLGSNDIVMTFIESETPKEKDLDQNLLNLYFTQNKEIKNYDLFKIYINTELLEKTDYTMSYNSPKVVFSLKSNKFTSIPKIKNLMVTYEKGDSSKRKLMSEEFQVEIKQEDFDTSTTYKLMIQESFDINVGEKIYFYILLYDQKYACYYGDFNKLNNIEATLKTEEKDMKAITVSQTKVEGFSQCEYTYRVEFEDTLKVAGYFDLNIKVNSLTVDTQLYIAPKDIDKEKSYFEGSTTFKAGETFFLIFTGTDSEGNNINYYDLIKEFDIRLINSSGDFVQKDGDNFTYNIKVNEENTLLNITMKLKLTDTYTLEALFKGEKMALADEFKITIEYGECSTKYPFLEIMKIDKRNEIFIGETVSVGIICKDAIGNVVEKAGDEIFTANIRQIVDNVTEIKYDYIKEFINGRHLISFTPSKIGKYLIDISLNGKIYGETQMVEIIPINKTKYTCMNKKQYDNIIECDSKEPTYKDFVREILTDSFMCYDTKKTGFIYKCSSSDEQCVSNTVDCDCLGSNEKWNGYCYSSSVNPIKSVESNKEKVTCKNKIKAKNPLAEVYECGDGSCRLRPEECNTAFECPLGYRSCGNKCILLNELSCAIQDSCSSDEVLCWDLSCAKNYDLCPTRITCPAGKVLCPDGSCQLTGHCLQPATRTCSSGQYQCPDFTCVANKDDCKKNPVCDVGLSLCENGLCQKSCQEVSEPDDKYRCPNGKYVDNSKLCPSDIFVPSGYVKCSSGGIAIDNDECQYVQGGLSITCPNTKPILCPDLSCVEKSSECKTEFIPKCPAHKPYQCWNNECRRSFDECPTPVTCPAESPVLCQNGFCAKSSDECGEKSEEKCTSKYRCFEGTCVASMELCPTHTYCGKDQIKCWNGACVNSIDECRSPNLESCSETFPYRCPDGSCRTSYQDCSSISTCPPNLPIKCFDNSCRASINECPSYQTCGENKVSCPDGTCAFSYDECNTLITCLSGSPYLCYDNTCKAQLSDCPEPPKCSKNEVLCPNGACVSSRQNCKIFDPCESIYPIRCDTNTCTDNLDKCSSSRKKRCPEGYVFCENGECKASQKNKPIKCKEGVCVHDASLCDNEVNGCPYNRPIKCSDGTCVKNKDSCVKDYTCSNSAYKLCPDGSCIDTNEECPLENGCYKDRPFKCADGTCINPSTSSCTPVLCPFNRPYKCPNGNCESKSSDCSNDLFESDLADCGDGLIMCSDGRCVESTDYCRPIHDCENSYTRCKDGTCRVSPDLCPKDVKCPESRSKNCNNNYCINEETECKDGLICPNGFIKCEKDGSCKSNSGECSSEDTHDICNFSGKKPCKNGRCIALNIDCSLVSEACPDDDLPYLCPNGECTNSLSNCKNIENDNICENGKVMCFSGRCVENKKEILATQCTNNIGCPLDKPYRCSTGDCVQSERNCEVTSILEDNIFRLNTICDSSKPYLCADKTCVSDTKFCKPSVDCPTGMQKCENGYCKKDGETCEQFNGLCPSANPIHCPSGTCVDDIVKCTTSFKKPTCNEGEFYCVRLNKCLKNKLDCLIYLESGIEKVKNNVRLLHEENVVNPLNDEDFIKSHKNKIISLKEEDDDPDKDVIKIEGTICYDGTIATGDEKCPIVPACKMGQYRCENGACASDKSLCPVDENYICLPGQRKCPDGLCHKDCSEVAFHGCDVNKYQCSNGQCLDDKYDCIGHSMCPDPTFPFRCMSGQCKSDPEECELVERLGTVKNLTYSFNKLNKIAINFAFDNNGHNVGRIEIPGNGLKLNVNYSNLKIEEVSSSMLTDLDLYNNSAEFLFNVSNSISGSEGVLNFENSVMSPVFKFYSKNKDISFKFAGKIDIAHNEYESTSLYYYDYCLAKLKGFDLDTDKIKDGEDKGWECVERQTKEGQTEFQISEFGVYAVILNPLRNKVNYLGDSTAKNFFVENVKIILIVLAIIIVIIALVFYIFLRVTRYRKKYHENREKILLMKQQREEYENMTTDIFGQTLGDNINGIVYKSNPAYTVTDEIKKAGTSLEDEIERLQIECKNVTEQNERLQKDIDEITKKYEQLSENIENMNK